MKMKLLSALGTSVPPNLKPHVPPSLKPHIVIDLEMCKVRGRNKEYGRKMEIIQIGAALLDSDFNIVSRFDKYVKPRFGYIDYYISNLTGIKRLDVEHAESLEEVLSEFIEWMPEDSIMVSWSMTDRDQLYGEIKAKNLQFDAMDGKFENWVDCQRMFSEKMNMDHRQYSLKEALVAADIFTEGDSHNGLVDACNTALLFAKMNTEENFELNPYYKKAHEEKEGTHLSYSIGDILSSMNFSVLHMDA